MNLEQYKRCNGCGCEWSGGRKPVPDAIRISRRFGLGKDGAFRFNAEMVVHITPCDAYERQRLEDGDLCETCIANLKETFLKYFTGRDAAEAVKKDVMEHIDGIRESLSTYGSRTDAHLRDTVTNVQATNIVRSYLEENIGQILDAHMAHRRKRKGGVA
jgi:hypothetical protein